MPGMLIKNGRRPFASKDQKMRSENRSPIGRLTFCASGEGNFEMEERQRFIGWIASYVSGGGSMAKQNRMHGGWAPHDARLHGKRWSPFFLFQFAGSKRENRGVRPYSLPRAGTPAGAISRCRIFLCNTTAGGGAER